MARKRQYKQHENHLKETIRKRITIAILIPAIILVSFIFFGPKIGTIFGFFSTNKNKNIKEDKVAPPRPIFKEIPSYTNKDTLTIEGFAEAKTTVKLFVNGPEVATSEADLDGMFVFENVDLIEGRNIIFTKSIDSEENESEKSKVAEVNLDKKTPDIEIDYPTDGATIKNLNERILIKGKINEKAKIVINEKFAVQKPDMSFEFTLGVKEGFVEIKIEATDEAGNVKTEELTIKYEKKS